MSLSVLYSLRMEPADFFFTFSLMKQYDFKILADVLEMLMTL
jgi:hypothetical protein